MLHNNTKVIVVKNLDNNSEVEFSGTKPIEVLFMLANKFKDTILIWCHESQENNLNIEALKKSFNLKNIVISYASNQFILPEIGFVEDSPFLKVNKQVKYPTWLMSSLAGAIHTTSLIRFQDVINKKSSLDYTLNSIAKLGMHCGLLCYSNPEIVKSPKACELDSRLSIAELFKFVKQHYKARWIILLLINFIWHKRQVPVISFLKIFFYKQIKFETSFQLEKLNICSIDTDTSIDVIIPTIGRKDYLYDVLKDLSVQTLLPKKVIIVEQNPDLNSQSELDYIKSEKWPFEIVHKFIHQTGVCNARNLALQEVESELVYLADDDNRFDENLLSRIVKSFNLYDLDVITMSYLQKDEIEKRQQPIQWSTFGAGSSVVKSKYLDKAAFNKALEFGYGEDVDFGMQLRNQGADIIYFPDIKILHLKAPIGGFRVKFQHPWMQDDIQPKPSPTVMLNRKENTTFHQVLGYKTTLFLKYYKEQKIKNPWSYFKLFKRQWQQSIFWANYLKELN